MSLGSIYYGDLTVLPGYSPESHGIGDLRVGNKAILGVSGSIGSLNASTGNLVVLGGVGILENVSIGKDLSVTGSSVFNLVTIANNLVINNSSTIVTSGTVSVHSNGLLDLQSTTGISIGTSNTASVLLGDTTIQQNLNVQGRVSFKDNIIQLNNEPTSTVLDGGLAIKRYQPANENLSTNLLGEIIKDTPSLSGLVTLSTVGSNMVLFTSGNLSTVGNFYKGYWVKMTQGLNSWVRRVKTSNTDGSILFYSTSESDGLNLPTSGTFSFPTTGTLVTDLYDSNWIMPIWDESQKEYSIVNSNSTEEAPITLADALVSSYSNFRANKLTGASIITNSLNGSVADTQFLVTLSNNTVPVTLNTTGSTPTVVTLQNYGAYMVSIKPSTEVINSPFAVFIGARRNKTTACGNMNRVASVSGENSEMLDMDWPANSYPRLFYTSSPGTIGNVQFTVKITSV